MPYLSTQDAKDLLRDDFEALYTLPNEQGDLDRDLADASAAVDQYLAKRYALPITDADALAYAKARATDLFGEIAWFRTSSSSIPEKATQRANNARDQLGLIAKGTNKLPGSQAEAGASGGSSGRVALVEGNKPEFTNGQMAGF